MLAFTSRHIHNKMYLLLALQRTSIKCIWTISLQAPQWILNQLHWVTSINLLQISHLHQTSRWWIDTITLLQRIKRPFNSSYLFITVKGKPFLKLPISLQIVVSAHTPSSNIENLHLSSHPKGMLHTHPWSKTSWMQQSQQAKLQRTKYLTLQGRSCQLLWYIKTPTSNIRTVWQQDSSTRLQQLRCTLTTTITTQTILLTSMERTQITINSHQ